jgi:hypothetical protein
MSATSSGQSGGQAGDSNLSSTYVLVLIVEAIIIAGLYWLGRYFG